MRQLFTLVIIAFCFLGAAGIYWYTRTPDGVHPQNETIVAFGDSLVAGVGATPGNDFVSVLSRTIQRPITNMGVSGNTTRDGIARLDTLLAQKPGVAILLLGGNDYLRQVPLTETEQNLAHIITTLQQEGSVVVLIGVRGGVFRDNFAPMYERLANTYDTLYVSDVLDGLIGNTTYMSDTIHPNDVGYSIIAERVAEEINARIEWQN